MSHKFKAAVLAAQNTPLDVEEIEAPELRCGQVLVKVHCASICGAQIGEITGAAGPDKYLPHLLGHEGGGVVVECGPGVMYVKTGDRVVMHWRVGVGIEAPFPRYKRRVGYVGAGKVTTFSEYAIVSENRLTTIAPDIPLDIAAFMGCAVTTGLGIINNEAWLKIGQSIAVIGCGGVGLNVIQGAAMVSANPIIGIDIYDEKLDKARFFGMSFAINLKRDSMPSQHFDVVVECTGVPEMIEAAYMITAPGGRLILVGQPRHDKDLTIRSMRQHFCGKMIIDSQGGGTNPTVDIPRYLKLYREGKLKLNALISHRYLFKDINKAIEMAKSGKAIRVMLEMK